MLRLGLFWLCRFPTSLESEGIGRHMIRLAEGLLAMGEQLEMSLITDHINANAVKAAFSHVHSADGNRLDIIVADDITWVNDNVDVDIWIIPYVGFVEAIQLNKPFVLCLHDLGYTHFPDRPRDNFSRTMDIIAPRMAEKAAAVVCNSNFVRENEGLRYLKLPQSKTQVIRLASPTEEYKTFGKMEETAFRQKYGLVNPYFVYPSAIRYYKNHDRLIEAFINFRNSSAGYVSKLLLVMTDNICLHPEQQKTWNLVSKYLDEEVRFSIVFINRIPAQEMPSLYYYAAGTIVPTLFEGSCPFPILESLVFGTPVAFSDIPVVWEVIPREEGVLAFNPYTVGEIEQAIGQLWEKRDILIAQQQRAFIKALSRTWKDVAQEYFSLMQAVLSS